MPDSRPPTAFTPGPLKKLFADRRDANFWQTEGMQHNYLYWVRAMLTTEVEPPPFTPSPAPSERGEGWGSEDARARHIVYDFLATAWTYPSPELCAGLATPQLEASLSGALAHLTGGARVDEIIAALRGTNLERLRGEYTRLFYDSYLPFIPPYESVYCNERQVMGKRAATVIEFYRRAGLSAEGEMPDHIAHECEFVSYLAGEQAAASGRGDQVHAASLLDKQIAFLREHLLPWGAKFCADLACLARGDFYAATARLGSALFIAEWSNVDRVASELDYPATIT